jgi:hypothetical protein
MAGTTWRLVKRQLFRHSSSRRESGGTSAQGTQLVILPSSVPVPAPDPDPLVRGMNPAPDPSMIYHQAKIIRKTLIPTVLRLLLEFSSLKNDVNVPSKSNEQII